MSKLRNRVLSGLLGCFVGTSYFFLEVLYKTIREHQSSISWTMLALALLIGLIMERIGSELPWSCPLLIQSLLCGLVITSAEFISGCLVNLLLGWNVWNYSNLPGNILGQICPQFAVLWCIISGPVIVLLDWMRYLVVGGTRPTYILY